MITIGVVTPGAEATELHDFLSMMYDKDVFSNNIIMAAKDENEILGIGAVHLGSDCDCDYAVLIDIVIKNGLEMVQLEDSIAKALLNLIDRRGIKDVYCDNPRLSTLLQKIGFSGLNGRPVPVCLKERNPILYLNSESYFAKHTCNMRKC